MENNDLQVVLDSIVESVQCDDQEQLIETLDSVNDDCWKNIDSAISILDTFLTNVRSDFFVYPIEFIPAYLFENENFINCYTNLLCWFYNDELLDYNFTELIPRKVLKDKAICKKFLSCNYCEVVDDVPDEFWADEEVVFSALEGLENHIEYRVNTPMLTPPDITDCISYLFEKVSKELSNNKKFIIDFLSNYYFQETFEVVYKWMDKSLWSDKEFVLEVLDKDCSAIKYVSKELLKDAEILKYE